MRPFRRSSVLASVCSTRHSGYREKEISRSSLSSRADSEPSAPPDPVGLEIILVDSEDGRQGLPLGEAHQRGVGEIHGVIGAYFFMRVSRPSRSSSAIGNKLKAPERSKRQAFFID